MRHGGLLRVPGHNQWPAPQLELSDRLRGWHAGHDYMKDVTFDVVIVGAGPAGLSCALSLITNGVKPQDIIIVDAQGKGLNSSRAIVVHARTLEVNNSDTHQPSTSLLTIFF